MYVIGLLLYLLLIGCSSDSPMQPGRGYSATQATSAADCSASDGDCLTTKSIERDRLESAIPGLQLKAKYSYIRSYPGGGGLFIVELESDDSLSGSVSLRIEADAVLNAELDRQILNRESDVAEITIRPEVTAPIKTYRINVIACRPAVSPPAPLDLCQTVELEIEMLPWGGAVPDYAQAKRDELLEWVEATHSEFGRLSAQKWYPYMTYPGILVVEHWTFLNEEWEMRVCFHVMIPPYDWSMIQLRERGEVYPIFAAKREYNGTTYQVHEIPVSEYPTFFGY
jgi:hypothetical protein